MTKVLTVIPARGGSKGITGKNHRLVYGQPLITWTIKCALQTSGLDRIIVSSDDDEILTIAEGFDGVTALRRPEHLAADNSSINDTIEHLLSWEENAGNERYESVLLLQPTAPIREPRHIHGALQTLRPGINSVISLVASNDVHPARMYQLGDNMIMQSMFPDYELSRRQDIPPAYYRNGSIYLTRTEAFRSQNNLMAKPAAGYLMEENLLLNIDEPRDLMIAEPLIKAWQQGHL